MNKKHFFKTLLAFYVVFQLLTVLVCQFTSFNATINAVLFTITVLLSLICSITICKKQNPTTTNTQKKTALIWKTLIATQVVAMFYVILYAVFPTLENISVLSNTFSIFMIPEQILMDFFSNILYILQMGVNTLTSNIYLDRLFLSVYPFIAMVIFTEVYLLFASRNKTAK